jgi:phage shock protein PspC (stress-responsive transcriptional regulator)
MDKTVVISLNGHAGPFRLEGDAYDLLSHYLDRAAARLPDDSDRAEVLGDLERSVGDKLVALLGSEDRVVTAADIDGILEEIGGFDTDSEQGTDEGMPRRRGRSLHRIREGKQVAGVCTGLAAYTDLDVAWVRTLFVLATVFTAGIFAVVYIVMAFVLPVAATSEAAIPQRIRHLDRIREGKQIAGVCTGLAAYAELDVAWVRTLFFFATLLTAGGFALVYIVLAFMLPVRAARPTYHR